MKIAICDDNENDIRYLKSLLDGWKMPVQIDTFPSAEAFLFRYAEKPDYDILLLDIEMAAMDGITLARKIRSNNETIQIVFISGYSEYIADGYDVAALHFLVKPVRREKFYEVMERAVQKVYKNEKALYREVGGEMVRIALHEIRWVEVQRNYITVHTKEDYEIRSTLSDFEKELNEDFMRVGRSCIVNLNWVQKVTRTMIYLLDGAQIPLPRGQYDVVNRAIIAYC